MLSKGATVRDLNRYQQAIVRNAEWFLSRQRHEGLIDADGDEFYGIRGDATLVGHSATVRMYAYELTGETRFVDSARRSLDSRFDGTLIRAADRMVQGTLADDGRLILPNIIEIGEYAHFAMLAYKATGLARLRGIEFSAAQTPITPPRLHESS